MAWSDESAALILQLRSYLANLEDAHSLQMVPAWARAWDDLAPELEAALNELVLDATDGRIRRSDLQRSQRLQKALETIQARLDTLVDESGQFVIDKLSDVVDYSGALQERIIGTQLPPGEQAAVNAWSRVDAGQITAIVERTTEQITKLSFPLSDEAVTAMRRNLIRGVALGENPRRVAGHMVKHTEGLFNGGLSRATTIARTEMLDAQRAAAQLAEQPNADLLKGWVWLASLSERTCPACWGMNGQEFPLTESGPNGHQNCRCSRGTLTKSWKDLGFDIPEPPSILPNAERVFGALPTVDQKNILGAGRFKAWQDGNYPMSDWATKRSTPGWRDSYVVSKVPA